MKARWFGVVAVVCAAGIAVACSSDESDGSAEVSVESAKAAAIQVERDIVALVPEDAVRSADVRQTGTLLSCSGERWSWNGSSSVFVEESADMADIVRSIARGLEGREFRVSEVDVLSGAYTVQASSEDDESSYIIGEDTPGEIRIDAGSACFTLPEDVWPGGTF